MQQRTVERQAFVANINLCDYFFCQGIIVLEYPSRPEFLEYCIHTYDVPQQNIIKYNLKFVIHYFVILVIQRHPVWLCARR